MLVVGVVVLVVDVVVLVVLVVVVVVVTSKACKVSLAAKMTVSTFVKTTSISACFAESEVFSA